MQLHRRETRVPFQIYNVIIAARHETWDFSSLRRLYIDVQLVPQEKYRTYETGTKKNIYITKIVDILIGILMHFAWK